VTLVRDVSAREGLLGTITMMLTSDSRSRGGLARKCVGVGIIVFGLSYVACYSVCGVSTSK